MVTTKSFSWKYFLSGKTENRACVQVKTVDLTKTVKLEKLEQGKGP